MSNVEAGFTVLSAIRHSIFAFFQLPGTQSLIVPEDLPRGFVFPVSPLLDRPVKCDRLVGAIGSAATAVPAFIRVQDDWRLFIFRVGNENIHLADFYAVVAAGTDIMIENYRISRADNVG
jgi:hypothetical protein